MTDTTAFRDQLDSEDRVYLEKLRLAVAVILRLGEDDGIPATLESELYPLRDRVERALLLQSGRPSENPRMS